MKKSDNSDAEGKIDSPEENGDTTSATTMDDVDFTNEDIDIDDEGTVAEKLKALRDKLKVCQSEKGDYLAKLQRTQAEFINLRKRDEEEKKNFVQFAKAETLNDLIPILITFERALLHKDESGSKWRAGVEQVYAQLKGVLERHGLTSLGEVGESFSPLIHEAMATVPTDDKESDHTVADVLERGFALSGKTLRPAKVKIFEYTD